PRLASRRAPPSLRGRRSARTTTFPDSPRGAHRRASAAAARLARPRSQTRLAARPAEPPRPPLRPHDPGPRPASRPPPPRLRGRRSARTTTRGSGVSRAAILCDGGCALKGVLDSRAEEDAPMELRLAVVQPETLTRADAPKNVDRAVAYIRQAAREGARLLALPETYPGPYTVPVDCSPHEALAAV